MQVHVTLVFSSASENQTAPANGRGDGGGGKEGGLWDRKREYDQFTQLGGACWIEVNVHRTKFRIFSTIFSSLAENVLRLCLGEDHRNT